MHLKGLRIALTTSVSFASLRYRTRSRAPAAIRPFSRSAMATSLLESEIRLERAPQPNTYLALPSSLFSNAQNSAHGGYLLAVALSAARDALGPALPHPASVHASYLAPVMLDASPWTVKVETRKAGKRFAFLSLSVAGQGQASPGFAAEALFSSSPPDAIASDADCPTLPPPEMCVEALAFARQRGLSEMDRPHTVNPLDPSTSPDDPTYASYVGWRATPCGGYLGAAYWVDGLVPIGLRAQLARGGKLPAKGYPTWVTLTMTVEFCSAMEPGSAAGLRMDDGTELLVAKESIRWVAGGMDGGRVGEEVELWDPANGRLLCRTKQVGLLRWAGGEEKAKM
ncbi:thioesterase-like superfamily-domain-containing protein [Hyaloraphidium curvatum]|nr:thioesterase-like superfamily-domain-containing protein [Hyaloraphidium curvatum]